MGDDLIFRLLSRSKELGLSPRAVSLNAGMGPTAVRDIVRKPGASPSTTTILKLAKALNVDPEWLAFGSAKERAEAEDRTVAAMQADLAILRQVAIDHGVPEETIPKARKFVRPLYGGIVEAGSFREANDFDDDPARIMPSEEVDDRFPDVPLISYTVAGDSMNDLKPTPILPGQRVIGLDFEGLANRVDLRDGMVVVVEQKSDGGHLRERSVKQIKLHRERTEFWPRSTNPKHKPIVVTYQMMEQGSDDGSEVSIIAIIRRVVSDLPGW